MPGGEIPEYPPRRALGLDGSEMAGLVEELTARGASARFVARGGSMSPWIRDGDVVTVVPAAGRARAGDVAAFRRPGSGQLTVHRLLRRVPGGWVARGDRSAGEDGVVADGEVLGTVSRLERNGRVRFLPRGWGGTWLARLSRLGLGAVRWILQT